MGKVQPGTARVDRISGRVDRLYSLDCLRGATIVAMVLVNNPGHPDHVYPQLAHVGWHGMTIADVIAPWFLWVIGVTTALSLSRRVDASNRVRAFAHVVRRGAVLYALGVMLSVLPALLPGAGLPVLESLKVMGVLQRIAICYVLGGALLLLAGPWQRAVIALALLVGYWAVLGWIPGPAEGAGPFDATGNRASILDLQLMGQLGETGSHSLLTILAVTSTVLIGTLIGDLMRADRTAGRKLIWLLSGGIGLCIAGLLISQWIPINRRLWTPSFALLTSGMAMAALAGLYWLLDVHRLRRGSEWLVAYGTNPIFLFVLSELGRVVAGAKGITDAAGVWRSYWTVGYEALLSIADPKMASALFACGYVILLGFVAVVMYRKGWIVKI